MDEHTRRMLVGERVEVEIIEPPSPVGDSHLSRVRATRDGRSATFTVESTDSALLDQDGICDRVAEKVQGLAIENWPQAMLRNQPFRISAR